MQNAVDSPLLNAPIPGMIRKIGVPVSIGACFNTLYNIVDTIYGGMISKEALAALALAFPLYFIIIAFGFGFAQGATALIGNALGRDDIVQAQQRAIQGIVFGVIGSLLLTIVLLAVTPTLIVWMGAADTQLTLDYVNIVFGGAIFFVLLQMMLAILNALGDTIPGRNVLAAGFFLNLLLDPWFVFGGFGLPAMGIQGLAWATVLIQGMGCVYIAYKLAQTELISAVVVRRYWRPDWRVIGRIIEQGLPTVLDTSSIAIGFFILNVYVSRFGQDALSAMGGAVRLEQLAMLPMLGLNIAVVSLVARNNGAQQYARVQQTFRASLRYGSLVMLVTTGFLLLFARPLMGLFSNDPAIVEIGVRYVRIRSLGLIPNAIFFMSSSAMRGIERPYIPLLLNMLRFAILPLIGIIIFVERLGYGLDAIWIASTAAFFLMAGVGYFVAWYQLPRPETRQPIQVTRLLRLSYALRRLTNLLRSS